MLKLSAIIATALLAAGGAVSAAEVGVRHEYGTSTRTILQGERWSEYSVSRQSDSSSTVNMVSIEANNYRVADYSLSEASGYFDGYGSGSYASGYEYSASALSEENTNVLDGEIRNNIDGTLNADANIDIVIASLDVDGTVTMGNGYTLTNVNTNDLSYTTDDFAESNYSNDSYGGGESFSEYAYSENGTLVDGSMTTTTTNSTVTEAETYRGRGGSSEQFVGTDTTNFSSVSSFAR